MAGKLDLLQLQNLTKRDPGSYRDEVLVQWKHYQSLLNLFLLKPQDPLPQLDELVQFFGHVSSLYKKETADFPKQIMSILETHAPIIQPAFRKSCIQCLILLRNKGILTNIEILPLFFQLFRCQDKALREMLFNYIVSDIKNVNQKHKNHKLNTTLQNFMYQMVKDPNSTAANKSLDVMISLYRKNIWKDSKTVNVLALACLSEDPKISEKAIQFFLDAEDSQVEDEDSDKDVADLPSVLDVTSAQRHAKKTKKRQRILEKIKHANKKKDKLKDRAGNSKVFPALLMINDPQGMCEKLFLKLKKSSSKFEFRVQMMNLISRLIATHKLLELNFYPYMQKYLQPHQKEVTLLLAITSQACHDLVPPEVVEPLVKCLADNFVSDRCTPAAMAIGLNTIREICLRCPLCMNETLLRDLVQYKSYRDKSVSMAAKSLITVYRALNPALLHKKDRGRDSNADAPAIVYGQQRVFSSIPGIELVREDELANPDDDEAWKEKLKTKKRKLSKKGKGNQEEEENDDEEDEDDDEEEIEELLGSDEEYDLSGFNSDDFEVIKEGSDLESSEFEDVSGDDDDGDDDGDDDDDGDEDEDDDGDDDDGDEDEDEEEEEEVAAKKSTLSKKGQPQSIKPQTKKTMSAYSSKLSKYIANKKAKAVSKKEKAGDEEEEYEDVSDEYEDVSDEYESVSSEGEGEGEEEETPKSVQGKGKDAAKPKPKFSKPEKPLSSSDSSGVKESTNSGKEKPDSKAEAKKTKSSETESQTSSVANSTASQARSLPLEATRILTPKDFELIKKKQKKHKLEEMMATKRGLKRKDIDEDDLSDDEIIQDVSERVDIGGIEPYKLKVKRNLQERLASIQKGRDDREKFGYKKNKGGGSTNKEKLKSKPFVLQKQKREIREKHLRSSKDKQRSRRDHMRRLKSKMKK